MPGERLVATHPDICAEGYAIAKPAEAAHLGYVADYRQLDFRAFSN